MSGMSARCLAALVLVVAAVSAAAAQPGQPFDQWLEELVAEARGQGFSEELLGQTLVGLTPLQRVIASDRAQPEKMLSIDAYVRRRVTPEVVRRAREMTDRHRDLLAKVREAYGVPPRIVVAIWGLETDFGSVRGNMSTIRSLATLAYDCRRSDFFTGQLVDALRVADRGDLSPNEMRGGWAGELGQTQFLPSSYVAFAVDYDGDGRPNLISSTADVLASTANYLRGHGWQPGQPWTEGTANFAVITQWNKAQVYARTVAEFARQLAEG